MTFSIQLPEHLKNYYNSWKKFRNEENSIEQYRNAYEELREMLKPDPSAIPLIPVADRATVAMQIDQSTASDSTTHAVDEWHAQNLLCLQTSQLEVSLEQTSRKMFKYVDPATFQVTVVPAPKPSDTTRKRKAADQGDNNNSRGRRAPRTCVSCRSTTCPGRWSSSKCSVLKAHPA